MNIFWILVIIAAILIFFSGIFGFRGAGSIGWTILRLGIMDTFRTVHFEEIASFKYKIEEFNLSYVCEKL